VRDFALLDALQALQPIAFDGPVWRVCREGRDPTLAAPSLSRWCDGAFPVLYTSQERDGAIAEISSFLRLQPVLPSKTRWFAHQLELAIAHVARFADLSALAGLGVDVKAYGARQYARTAEIAEAANFLGFDGLIAPSARWSCANIMVFADNASDSAVRLISTEAAPIDWAQR
jgi:RES domain-containing protein